MMIKPVKTAVVGCGGISDAYLSTMANKFKILELAGCCDLNAQRAQEKAQKYAISVLSMEQILADDSIELVVNLTTPEAHYPVVKQLLEAGKHVYTEKVLAVELEQAAELVEIANRKRLYLGAAPDTFLGSAIQTARYVVDSGMIGEVSSCNCTLTRDGELFSRAFPFTARPGGGIGFDVGIYAITALLSILGPVREVAGIVRTRDPHRQHVSVERFDEDYPIQCENLMAGMLNFDCGAVGTLLFEANSIFTAPEKPSLVLYGTLGVLYMADPNQFGGEVRVILKGNNEPTVMQQSHAYSTEYRGLGVAEMAWSLRQGRANRASKEMAYHALEVLHGIVRSSAAGASQAIQSSFEKAPPLPRGYSGQQYFEFIEEMSIAV
jgi:predicted dehydrogenase